MISPKFSSPKPRLLRAILLTTIALAVPIAGAATPAATVVTLTASASTVAASASVLLTATVTSGGVPVTQGQVAICNQSYACTPSLAFAVLPLSSSGTATVKAYGVGLQYFQAGYTGTAAFAASNSGLNYTTVTFTNTGIPTSLSITPVLTSTAGTPAGNTQNIYTLTANVASNSQPTTSPSYPASAVNFYDTSNGNLLLGTPAAGFSGSKQGFIPGATLPAGRSPLVLATGDFNNDGHPDLAIVNTGDNNVSILLGNGDGTFQPAVNYNVGGTPNAIVAGDFNADGNLDLAVVNNLDHTISILFGTGTGTFATQVTYPTGNNPIALGMGDLNGDGYPDLVVLNHDDQTVGVLLNSGTGTFAPQATYATGYNPTSIAVGVSDLSGVTYDNIPDVAIANAGDNTITVLDGKGDGTLLAATAQTTFPTGNGPTAVIFSDAANGGYNSLAWLNSLDSTMTIIAAQYDASVYFPTTYSTGLSPTALIFEYFLNQGTTAPVVLNSDGSLSTYYTDGNEDAGYTPSPYITYPTTQTGATSMVVGDFNGDGLPEVAIGGTATLPAAIELQQQTFTVQYVLANLTVPGNSTSNIIATYPGDSPSFLTSTSPAVSLIDSPIVTATSLAISPTTTFAAPGQVVTMTANMTPTSVGNYVPTGSFEFLDGATVVCASVPMVSFTASCSTSALPISHNVFTAVYLGDTYFGPSTSQAKVVNIANTTSVSLSLSATSVLLGTGVIATATVTQASGGALVNGGVVNFCSTTACTGSALLASSTLQTANGTAPGAAKATLHLATGAHTIYAEFVGTSQNAPMASAGSSLTVSAPAKTESITSLASSGSAGNYTLTATVLGVEPSAAPTGTVSFTDTKNTLFTVQSKSLTTSTTTGYTFDPATSVPYGGNATVNGILVADVNGDGINDLIYTNIGDETLEIKLGTGGGNFAAATEYALSTNPYCTPEGVTVADLNGDGYPDIIIADDGYDFENSVAIGKVYIFLGKSNGTFSAMPDVTVDIGDETVDALPYTYPGPNSVAIADLNGDGIPDMAVGTDEGTVYTLIGNGDGTFQTPVLYPSPIPAPYYFQDIQGLSLVDINNDGFLDLAYTQIDGIAVAQLGNGDGTFQPAISNVNNSCNGFNWAAAFVDFNGDGKPDFVTSGGGQQVCVQQGNGDGTFGAISYLSVPNNDESQGVAVADFTGDGKLDIAVAYGSGIAIFAGNGDGTFGAVKTFSGGSDDVALATGDLNGDGLPDLVADASDTEALELFTSRLTLSSSGKFTAVSIPGSATTSQHNLVATYAGDTAHTASTSAGVKIAGTPIPTTTTLSIAPSSSQPYGVAEALTATVTPTITSSFTMAGTVTFKDSTTSLTPTGAFTSGTMNSTYTPAGGSYLPVPGTHSYTAIYNVDSVANFKTSTATALPFVVTKATPVITWAPPATINTGTTLATVLTATTPAPGSFTYTATPTGGSPSTVVATTVLPVGTYTVTASFTPTTPADYNTPTPVVKSLTVLVDHVWVLNKDASISELDDAGTPLSGSAIISGGASTASAGAIAFDNAGKLWSVAATGNQLLQSTSTGASPTLFTGGGLSAPVALAIDGNGAVWIANSTGNSISEFTNTGTATSPATTGYTAPNTLSTPSGVAIDSSGNVWISNTGNNSVTEILGTAAPAVAPLSVAVQNGTLGTTPQ